MTEMSLLEALQTDQVKGVLATLLQEAVADLDLSDTVAGAVAEGLTDLDAKIKTAVEAQLPTLRESVHEQVTADVTSANQLRALHVEATRLIEASPLKGAAKQNLLDDYGLVEADDEQVTPGRALALIEAVKDDEDKVTKSAKVVLREAIEADIKRVRNVLRESAPTIPRAPGGGDQPVTTAGGKPDWVKRLEDQGLNPKNYGYDPAKAAA